MWRRLPPPFNELWLTWQQEGASAGAAPEETPEQEAGREAFVRQLVQSTMQAAAAETAAKAAQAAQGGGDDAGPQQWSQELQRALARPVSDHHRARQRADSDRMLRTLRMLPCGRCLGGEHGCHTLQPRCATLWDVKES